MNKIKQLVCCYIMVTLAMYGQENQIGKTALNDVSNHQILARLAWDVLVQEGFPVSNINMANHIGPGGENEYSSSWTEGTISAGSYREDKLPDPVYGYTALTHLYGHFWDSDGGDNYSGFGSRENAYQRAKAMIYGETDITIDSRVFPFNQPLASKVTYTDIFHFFNTGECTLNSWTAGGTQYYFDEPYIATQSEREIISYEILGRVAHLIGDMGTPAHALNDDHIAVVDPDEYETTMEDDTFRDAITEATIISAGGALKRAVLEQNPLHYLMYTTNQIAQYFKSDDAAGNATYSAVHGQNYLEMVDIINQLLSTYGLPGGVMDPVMVHNIRDNSYVYSARATAGLYLWFAYETGQLTYRDIFGVTGSVASGTEFDTDALLYGNVTLGGPVEFHSNHSSTKSIVLVEAGTNISFPNGGFINIDDVDFSCDGTAISPITFQGVNGSDWTGLNFLAAGSYELEHCLLLDLEDAVEGSNGGTGGIEIFDDASVTIDQCTISGSRYGIWADGTNNLTVNNTIFSNISATNIFANGLNLTVGNCEIQSGYRGIYFTNATSVSISNTSLNVSGRGIECVGSSGISISGCQFNSNTFGVYNPTGSVTITNCAMTDGYYGVYASTGNPQITISECTLNNNDYDGLYLANGADATILRTKIMNNGRYGINIGANSTAKIGTNTEKGQNIIESNGNHEINVGSTTAMLYQGNAYSYSDIQDNPQAPQGEYLIYNIAKTYDSEYNLIPRTVSSQHNYIGNIGTYYSHEWVYGPVVMLPLENSPQAAGVAGATVTTLSKTPLPRTLLTAGSIDRSTTLSSEISQDEIFGHRGRIAALRDSMLQNPNNRKNAKWMLEEFLLTSHFFFDVAQEVNISRGRYQNVMSRYIAAIRGVGPELSSADTLVGQAALLLSVLWERFDDQDDEAIQKIEEYYPLLSNDDVRREFLLQKATIQTQNEEYLAAVSTYEQLQEVTAGSEIWNYAEPDYTAEISVLLDLAGLNAPEYYSAPPPPDSQGSDVMPSDYTLTQNYPNPFNPSTTLAYSVPKEEQVSLIIFDMRGKEVSRLVDNVTQSAGRYEVTWTGLDHNGQPLPAGIYMYRLQAGTTSQVKKMTYIK
jgi:parallel beta-helix repeat protein